MNVVNESFALSSGGACQKPPVKVLSCQLRESSPSSGQGSSHVCFIRRWGGGRSDQLGLNMVWMQGTVLDVTDEQDTTVRLQDETGTFAVIGARNVPKGRPCLFKGNYVMVIGSIQSCSPEPVLRAIKITGLSENPMHRRLWQLEVEDLQEILP
ncbi:recQ-mediated genome instability protein 2 [Erpetoichthys calabaricus]|uniref:RecQ mediated genome instability 2 n=1 Tax=Erpetoichthys calabaricus TaxID=27687 RepID=A0A8C4SH83_ERPCA|nr:recQ-mediated genome instability protein 2 [Erpetoichthys calabaricus]